MKKLLIAIPVLSTLLSSMAGCKKNEIKYGDFDVVGPDKALLKVNVVSPYQTNPSMYIGLDGNRISNPITSRTPFPGGGYNTGGGSTADYMAFAPGKHAFKLAIPAKDPLKVGADSIVLFQTDITIEAGISQSLHVCDTAANTQVVIVVDDRVAPDSGTIKYNFVHLIPNVPAIDLYYGTTIVAANVPYKGNKSFSMALPASSLAWTIRPAGDAATSLATYTSSSTIGNKRVYTVFASGFKGATDATRKPFVSFFLNW
jgi:hypothetical protein